MARDRNQIVIDLGEGEIGAKRKAALNKEAEKQRMNLSEWVRTVLYAEAKIKGDTLIERIERLERAVFGEKK